jgi:hydroxymethylglutaryl-CoA synthase
MIGLAATLDIAKAGDRIFVASFGSGAGSDAFDIEVTDEIEGGSFRRDAAPGVEHLLKDPIYIDYAQYARHEGKIVMQGTPQEFLASDHPKVKAFLERDFDNAQFAA